MDNPVKYKKLPADPCLSQEQIFRYLDGKLSPTEMHAVEKHLIECDFCSDALEGLQLVKDRSKVASMIPLAGEEKKEEEEEPKIIPLFRNRRIIFALAASVVLVLGISVVMRISMNGGENAKMADASAKADSTSVSIQKPEMAPPAPPQDGENVSGEANRQLKDDEPGSKMLAEKRADELKNAPKAPVATEGPKGGQGMDNLADMDAQKKELEKDQVVAVQQQAEEQQLDVAPQPAQTAKPETNAKPDENKKNENLKDKAATAPMAAGGAVAPRAQSNSHYANQEDDYVVPQGDTTQVVFDVPAAASDKESESNYNTGIKLLNAGNAAAALPYFDSILANPNDPLFEDAQWQKAEALLKLNRKDEAKSLLNDIVKKNGKYKKQAEDKLKTL